MRDHLYSDWGIYLGIAFHIFSNAVKFSAKGQRISIQVRLVRDDLIKDSAIIRPLAYYLETKIINFGSKFLSLR